ncbi:MAG: hypothetical protein RL203_424, partial [Pseudomonadota bacterium]
SCIGLAPMGPAKAKHVRGVKAKLRVADATKTRAEGQNLQKGVNPTCFIPTQPVWAP